MDNKNEVLIYEDKDGKTCVDVKFIDEDVSDEVVKADLLGLIWTNRNAFYPNGQLEFTN